MNNSKLIYSDDEHINRLVKNIYRFGYTVVGSTIGPCGRTVYIDKHCQTITKDGHTVAASLEGDDPISQAAAKIVKEAAKKTDDEVGDGTTTTSILLSELVAQSRKRAVTGYDVASMKAGMHKANKIIQEKLLERSKTIESPEQIAQIATISSGDYSIGKIIADCREKVGNDGVITVEEAKTTKDLDCDIVKGMHFDKGFLSPYFTTDAEKSMCEMDSPYILLCGKKILSIHKYLTILEKVSQSGKPLLVIAEDCDSEALTAFVLNKLRGCLKVAVVKSPGFGDNKQELLQDIACVTGATIVTEETGITPENLNLDMLGTCKKIIVEKEKTILIGGNGEKDAINSRVNQLRKACDETKSDYDREKLQERLAKMSGGIGVIRVGGSTEIECKEKKDRVEDALNATKAAIASGIIAGGGSALLYASSTLKNMKGDNEDETEGIKIVYKSLKAPLMKICENAGSDGSVIIDRLLDKEDYNMIFDAKKRKYVNAFDEGIVDACKIIKKALDVAISITGVVLTTNTLILDKPKDDNDSPAGDGGGMMPGGMGGF